MGVGRLVAILTSAVSGIYCMLVAGVGCALLLGSGSWDKGIGRYDNEESPNGRSFLAVSAIEPPTSDSIVLHSKGRMRGPMTMASSHPE